MDKNSPEYLQSIVAACSGAALVVNEAGQVVAVNEPAFVRFGFQKGQWFCELFNNADKAKIDLKFCTGSAEDHLFSLCLTKNEPLAFFGSNLGSDSSLDAAETYVLLRVETQGILSERFNSLPQDRLLHLNRRLEDEMRRRQALELEKATLEQKMQRDQKTHLLTPAAFNEALLQHTELEAATSIVMIFLDLDSFKSINDNFGHDAGDLVIVEMGRILRENLRKNDLAARLGGDEFAVALCGTLSQEEVEQFIQRLQLIISKPLPYIDPVSNEKHFIQMGFTAGIARYPQNTSDISLLLKYADRAMYDAKQHSVDDKPASRGIRPH